MLAIIYNNVEKQSAGTEAEDVDIGGPFFSYSLEHYRLNYYFSSPFTLIYPLQMLKIDPKAKISVE